MPKTITIRNKLSWKKAASLQLKRMAGKRERPNGYRKGQRKVEDCYQRRYEWGERGIVERKRTMRNGIQMENMKLQEVFIKRSKFALGFWSSIMECHPSIAAFRDFIKMYQQMQIETHLDNTLDSARQDRKRPSSCLALRSSITLFMHNPSTEVKKMIVVDSVAPKKNYFV